MTDGCMVSAACATSIPLISAPSACPFRKTTTARFRRRTLSCRASGGGGRGGNDGLLWLPRRDMMLNGLSGVAAGLAWYPSVAYGDDEKKKCDKPDSVDGKNVQCTDPAGKMPCPPLSSPDPVPFTPAKAVTRVRQPVHGLKLEQQLKYKEAVRRMKDLDDKNPLSFKNQAAIHEAYCDAHYKYNTDRPFDVHYSWLFAPWHRMYIYFYERALGQLIGDDTFALPYWSWDVPEGMVVPPLFKDDPTCNPLYDANRNPDNVDALVDLEYLKNRNAPRIPFNRPEDDKYKALVNKNLCTVYTQQVKSGTSAQTFLGDMFCTANLGSGTGSLEAMAHTAMHVWVGKAGPKDPKDCTPKTGGVENNAKGGYDCNYDMGFLGRAGRDPLFYSHHSNVDRMWHLWSTRFGGKGGIKFQTPELDKIWNDTTFVFYDDVHNPKKVSIKFCDILDTTKLGYTFDPSYDKDLPWLKCNITPLVPHGKDAQAAQPKLMKKALKVGPAFPLDLTKGQVVEFTDVALKDSDKNDPAGKKEKEVLLVIDDIEFDPQQNNKFDVAINVPNDKALQVGPQHTEYAGTFTSVPGSGSGTGTTRKSKVTLCITRVLNDIDVQDDKTVDIVIVPRSDAKVTLNVRPTIMYQN